MNNKVKLVTHEEQAIMEIRAFQREGYTLEEIYVIAHDDGTTEGLSKLMSTNKVGMHEQGLANTFTNLFRSRGDQLRVKMHSLGLSKEEADRYEQELDKGKIMVMAWNDDADLDGLETDWTSLRREDTAVAERTRIYTTERTRTRGIW
ncbi:general stress protein [Paenibacillus sp. FSL H8-0034]|uniref:general stress protein n=1 Tax=Paenibacillus sp. FSL H8-0034 TaxID=2954671 RepID=UPI0030F90B4A